MKYSSCVVFAIAIVLVVSCGGGGGRSVYTPPTPTPSDYPSVSGTYLFTFTVESDPNQIVGRILTPPEVLAILVSSSGSSITGIDSYSRLWNGQFTSKGGDFTIACVQTDSGASVRSTATGTFSSNSDSASGTYVQVLLSGFGDDDGATVTGSWVAVKQ